MRVLLLGGGGREHALGWKLAQSERLTELISAPGNPGLAEIGSVVPALDPNDVEAVTKVAAASGIDLVVVGPEAPLAAGVVDALEAKGIRAFGPTRAGAQLEASKRFSKDVMTRAGVPTAEWHAFSDFEAAEAHLEAIAGPYVVKADGLAAGKGVLVTDDPIAAKAWARLCIEGHFGEAGSTVIVEEHLDGTEVSVFALCDGDRAVPLQPARDYKRLRDGGEGPNTGGMGCFSPVDDLPADLVRRTVELAIDPVLRTLAADGIVYRGFLYAGLMLTADGVKVLEYNCRMGDPETQVVLPRLDEDLLALLADPLPDRDLRWSDMAAVDIVLASPGYPDSTRTGQLIKGLDQLTGADDVLVFHAGTEDTGPGLATSGGRVLNVVGLGPNVESARSTAYAAVERVQFDGMHYRRDIAR